MHIAPLSKTIPPVNKIHVPFPFSFVGTPGEEGSVTVPLSVSVGTADDICVGGIVGKRVAGTVGSVIGWVVGWIGNWVAGCVVGIVVGATVGAWVGGTVGSGALGSG